MSSWFDDDPLLSDLVVRAVRRGRFCQVDAVSTAQQALARLRTKVYDLILSDLRMPEMDGPTFYRNMRAEHPTLVDRIVFMSSQVAHYDQFIRDTGAPLLSKPFAKEELDAVLARMIGPARPRSGAHS